MYGKVKYKSGKDETGKDIITREKIGEHGHSLKNICKSASKYDGHVYITHEENIFSVEILLYVQDI